ncbi:hypothetical protein K7G98_30880, partial [Saccharothrix sp. MB29]|nr:hypothetical protein [Saccharothrix sp. MB29]
AGGWVGLGRQGRGRGTRGGAEGAVGRGESGGAGGCVGVGEGPVVTGTVHADVVRVTGVPSQL